jgi:3-phosphoshikimate 1-carboxyvinyltransferase
MNQTLIAPAKLRGTVRTPGDKSISHRAVLISALANGASTVVGCSNGADVADTIRIVRQLGATVTSFNDQLTIVGPSRGLNAATEPLDCGNSGTTMRLLCGGACVGTGTPRLDW